MSQRLDMQDEFLNMLRDFFEDLECKKYLRKQSVRLYEKLLTYIGTEEEVKFRRDITDMHCFTKNVDDNEEDFVLGSHGEGFRLPWSDLDIMTVHKQFITTAPDFILTPENESNQHLFVSKKSCQPGFCKLYLPNSLSVALFNIHTQQLLFVDKRIAPLKLSLLNRTCKVWTDVTAICTEEEGGKCFFSHGYLDLCLSVAKNLPEGTKHGPCITSNKFARGYDRCFAIQLHQSAVKYLNIDIKCKELQTVTMNSSKEGRKSQWQHFKHVHVVPKGPKHGDKNKTQWQISFAVIEKSLIHNLNHTQFICFGLLKILVHIMKTDNDNEDGLCSFHLKTILLHIVSKTCDELWIPSNLIICFWICFTRLIVCISRGECQHFFMSNCNIFQDRFRFEKRQHLLDMLMQLYKDGIQGIICYIYYRTTILLEYLFSKHVSFNSQMYTELISGTLLTLNCYQDISSRTLDSIVKTWQLINNNANSNERKKTFVLQYIAALYFQRYGTICYNLFKRHVCNFSLLGCAERALQIGKYSDATCGPLLLATLYFCEKRYDAALRIINEVATNIDRYTLSDFNGNLRLVRVTFKLNMSFSLDTCLIPAILKPELKKCGRHLYQIDGTTYTFFLKFLCHHARNERTEMNECHVRLKTCVRDAFDLSVYCMPGTVQNILNVENICSGLK